MWITCSLPIVLVVTQAILFARNAQIAGQIMGLSDQQMKAAMKSSAIVSIGPSLVILSGMLSLLVVLGGPVAWMRLSLIGSVMFESLAAGFGTAAVGVELRPDTMTEIAFVMALWTMILCSIGWVIFATISANQMEKVQKKLVGGNIAKLTVISSCAIIGAFAAFCAQHLVKLNKYALAVVLGGAMMYLLQTLCEKKQIGWLRDWALAIAILGGTVLTAIIPDQI